MNKKHVLALAIILSAFSVCILAVKDVSADVILKPKWDQTYSSIHDKLTITDTVKGADVLLDKTKIQFYKACQNGESGFDSGKNGIKLHGALVDVFYCQHRAYNSSSYQLWRDSDETSSSDYYALATKSDVFGTSGATTKSYTNADDYIEILSPGAATDAKSGTKYDVYFKISNIRLKTGGCGSSGNTMLAILLGMGAKHTTDANAPAEGTSLFTARSFLDHNKCKAGALYDVEVRVKDKDGNNLDKSILWAFNDIDIMDMITGSAHTYDSTHQYAEHVKFISGILGDSNGYNISMVEKSDSNHQRELYPYDNNQNSSVVYHRFNDEDDSSTHVVYSDGSVTDNSASVLVRAYTGGADGFKFEWGGSTCGSYIDDAPAARFQGKTTLSYNNKEIASGKTVPISGDNSGPIKFTHSILRVPGDSVSGTINEPYYVEYTHDTDGGERPDFGRNSIVPLTKLSVGKYIDANTKTISSVSLRPGESKLYSEKLFYRYSDINDDRSSFTNAGAKTITLERPVAKFSGSISTSVMSGNASVPIGGDKTVKIASSTGEYTVSFKNNILRSSDGAGGTVGSPWNASVKNINAGVDVKTGSGTASLQEGKGSDVATLSYSGTLRFGESIKFCGYLNYAKVVSYSGNDNSGHAEDCVTIYRENTKCDFDEMGAYVYGLDTAKNYGWVGVKNKTLSNSYTYTGLYDAMSVLIFARPTDEIRFEHRMCAGSLYPIRAKNLNVDVSYTATGTSSKDSGVGNKYLFRESLPMDNGTFSNPRSWSSTNPRSTFLGNSAEIIQNVNGWYWSPNASAQKKYRCGIPASDDDPGYYQIAGKLDCGRSGEYDIGIIDAGSVITQKLEWNDQAYNSNNNTFSNTPRTASASVAIPYNYILRPYVTNNSGNTGKVAYLGESLTMTPGVVTTPRANTAFSGNKRNYATISKPTTINVKYYFKTSGGSIISESSVSTSSRSNIRLNSDGLIDGTVGGESQKSVDNGGTQLPAVTVPIPNSGVGVGDKVCVEVSVYPADSHDAKDASSVAGAGVNDVALSEGSNSGSNWATAVSCSTIAKKPTISVESSNTYSATSFKTANYTRTIGAKAFRFGSWSEYGVFGRVMVGNMSSASLIASGAALGYSRDGYPAANGSVNVARANDDASAGGNKVSTKENSNECTFMTQTFANANCSTSTTSIGGVMASQYEQRIKERYSSTGGSFDVAGLGTKSYGGATYYDVSNYSGSDVIVQPSGIVRFDSKNNLYISSLPNISNAQFAEKGIGRPNHTIVYSAPNHSIVIDGDAINYDSGQKVGADDLTQVIIAAKNVYFTNRPTYINAIIIADNVNTCRFDGASRVAIGGKSGANIMSSNTCNTALRFDSPVIAKKIILNRTAGAGNGNDAIRRAEIFNLNMANFLWSFNQMSRLSQATTTYSRELPTRY